MPSINRSFVYKAKEGRHVRIMYNISPITDSRWSQPLYNLDIR